MICFPPWCRGGTYCGTRGKMLPIYGFSVRLRGAAGTKYQRSYSATFIDGTAVAAIPAGSICAAASRAPFESFRIVLRPRASPASPPAGDVASAPLA